MGNEVMILNRQELEANPTVIGENLAQLAIAIEDTKTDITEIQNRGFWKRLTNNNTRDLAESMLKQNDTISAFLTITQGIIFLSMNNVVVLGGIMDALSKQESTNHVRDNQYIGMAREYLGEAIKSAQRATNNEKEIENIKNELVVSYKNQYNQEKLLHDLRKELKDNKISDKQQDKIIGDLVNKIDKNFSMDKQQEQMISLLQREMKKLNIEDKRQAELIEYVKKEITAQDKEYKRQAEIISKLEKELDEKRSIDAEQTEILDTLKKTEELSQKLIAEQDLEDKRQVKRIDELSEQIELLRVNANKIQENASISTSKIKTQIYISYGLAAVGVILSILAILI